MSELNDLYEYYATQKVRPTFADFRDDAQLARYAEVRRNVMYRLMLPVSFFAGKRILEFGPDTGENALVFAMWGARMALVEPNPEAHEHIRTYFARFGAESRLESLVARPLLDFSTNEEFDVVVAEGFIYTVRPTSAWIEKTAGCLKRDGILIVSYMELYGSLIELLLKALYQSFLRSGAHTAGIEAGKILFQPKWDSIPHTRTLDSWFMDVIVNPFVRLRYFLEPADVLRQAAAGGLSLHASWPNYRDAMAMGWIKAAHAKENDLHETIAFIEQSRVSHVAGSKCFLPRPSPEIVSDLRSIVEITDRLIDEPSSSACAEALARVERVRRTLAETRPVASAEEAKRADSTLSMISRAFRLLGTGDADALVSFCRSDDVLISTWGMPNHYAVFRKE